MAKKKEVQNPTVMDQMFKSMSPEDQKIFRIFSELHTVIAGIFGLLSEQGKLSAMNIMDLATNLNGRKVIEKEMKEKK